MRAIEAKVVVLGTQGNQEFFLFAFFWYFSLWANKLKVFKLLSFGSTYYHLIWWPHSSYIWHITQNNSWNWVVPNCFRRVIQYKEEAIRFFGWHFDKCSQITMNHHIFYLFRHFVLTLNFGFDSSSFCLTFFFCCCVVGLKIQVWAKPA